MKKFLLVLVTAVGAAAVSAEAQGAEGRAGPLGRGHGQGLTLVPPLLDRWTCRGRLAHN